MSTIKYDDECTMVREATGARDYRRELTMVKRPANARQTPAPRELPLRIPEELPELDEAVMLLGNFYTHGTALRASTQARLRALIGELPRGKEECAAWKSALKGYRREMAELENGGHGTSTET